MATFERREQVESAVAPVGALQATGDLAAGGLDITVVRVSAWMLGFSSTESTSARSRRLQIQADDVRGLCGKFGSVLTHQLRVRCNWMPSFSKTL